MTEAQPTPEFTEDPLLRSARREALFTAALSALGLGYTIAYAALYGYGRTADNLRFIWGIPDWVFWGVVVPWFVCLAVSCWFSYWFVEDEKLEQAEPTPTDGPSESIETPGGCASTATRLPPERPEGP